MRKMRKMMKKLLVFALVLTMVTSNCMTSFASEVTDGNAKEVVCTGLEDCTAEEHTEGCLSREKDDEPDVVTCTKKEDCAANEHEDDCLSREKDDEPDVTTCTKKEDCVANKHEEGCLSLAQVPVATSEDGEEPVDTASEVVYVAKIGDAKFETLQEAINEATIGATVEILADGIYVLPSFTKKLTLEAAEGVSASIDMGSAKTLADAEVIFNNLTFAYSNENYIGLHHVKKVEYNNCTINGQMFLYGAEETFNKCTFNQTSANAYNVWTYGSKKVAFNDCTFNSAGKSVLVYNEGACATDLTVVNSKFEASSPVEGKAAIEIDTTLMPDGTKIVIDDKTTATGFANGSVSGNSLWNDKKNQIDLTVTVAEELVWPIMIASVGEEKFPTLQAAVAAATNGTEIKLLADTKAGFDIKDLTGIKLDLNGKTLTLGPAVGSEGTVSQGIRVLKNSSLEISNGTILGSNEASDHVLFAMANYGTLTLTDVAVKTDDYITLTINNRGNLTLAGTTSVENAKTGYKIAITNDPYNYHDNLDATLNIANENVVVGDVWLETGVESNNAGHIVLNISNGYIKSVKDVENGTTRVEGNITGGYFVEKPASEYIVAPNTAILETTVKDGVTYLYKIGEKEEGAPELAVSPAEPNTESKLPETATEEQKNVAEQITNPTSNSQENKGTTSFESTLPEASEVATEMNTNDHTEAVDSLNATLGNTDEENKLAAEEVVIHVRPYLDVQVEDVIIPADGSNKAPEVTLDITMKYDVVASTEKDADDIVTAEDKQEDSSKTVNAVVTEEGKTLDVEKGTPVEITVPLPEVFEAHKETIIVKHIKDDGTVYYYDAIVNDDSTITFINPNGFSTFIITADARETTIEFKTSDSTAEQVTYKATDVNTTELPAVTKAGYIHTGWTFGNLGGTYSGKLSDDLLTELAALFITNNQEPITATPVFIEAPASSGGNSSDDSIATEEKTEKPVKTDSVEKEAVDAGKDELGALIGDSYGLYKLALSVKLEGELDKATNIKIKVDGVTKADSVIILQKTADGWKAVPATAGDGYVIGKFTSLSEILIFVNPDGEVEAAQMAATQPAKQTVTTTPVATGDTANVLGYAATVVVAGVALAVLYFRKRRA